MVCVDGILGRLAHFYMSSRSGKVDRGLGGLGGVELQKKEE